MDGGNKVPLNLEAGLNITTSDMLTPLSQQTFQHNWQKYQGKFLPNSLRFEKNGWAAGWNVYNFDYNTYRKPENGYYVGIGQFNTYTKTFNIFETEDSYNPLYTVYVVPESVVTVGDVTVNDNIITGNVKGKPFQLTWDPVNHTLVSDTAGMSINYRLNSDYSIAATVVDDSSSFTYTFDILFGSALTGDAITGVSYEGYANNKHNWGQFVYDLTTGKLTTPEGTQITPTVTGNMLTFDYDHTVLDENIEATYVLEKFYPQFNSITWQDQTNKEKLLITGDATDQLPFNKYKVNVTPRVLKARDTEGVVIDYQIPLWAVAKLGVNRPDPNAKKCDNTQNFEIATDAGNGLRMGGTANNIFIGDEDFTIDSDYRPSLTKYIDGLTYRFNQIFLNNTIELSPNWDYRKRLLNTQVWYLNSRQFKNLRDMNTILLGKYLGTHYTFGTFFVSPTGTVDYNNPYDIEDEDNCIYTTADISNILSFKEVGTDDNTNTGDDEAFVASHITVGFDQIATFNATGTTAYDASDAAKTLSDLYDATGKYKYTTFEDVGTNSDPNYFWPFAKVPKFNFEDAGGTVHTGVYWTDGTEIIDNLVDYKAKVLGEFDEEVAPLNTATRENPSYNRTRIVRRYAPGYDFDYKRKSDFDNQKDYLDAVDAWNAVWKKYYPDTPSPQNEFDDTAEGLDTTYLDYTGITVVQRSDPHIQYVKPGVYVFGKKAIPFACPSGVIIFEDGDSYSFSAEIWHHAVQVNGLYTIDSLHEPGVMRQGTTDGINLPFYFGAATSDTLVEGYESWRFRTRTSSVSLESAKLSMGINYTWQIAAVAYSTSGDTTTVHYATATISNAQYIALVKGTTTLKDLGLGWSPAVNWDNVTSSYFTVVWTPATPDSKDWLGNVLLHFNNGFVAVSNATLNDGVEQMSNYYAVGDINQGIKFGWPLIGHSQTRLTYPEMQSISHINDTNVFVLEPVPTAELTDTTGIYFDRADTDKSQHLFNIIEQSRQPDDNQGGGRFCITMTPVNGGFVYYAKKHFNSEQEEILMDYYIPGVAWSGPSDESGYMSQSSQYPVTEIDWKPVIRRFPTNMILRFSDKNTDGSTHKFYTADKSALSNAQWELDAIDFDNLTQDIIIHFPAGDYTLHYDSANETTIGEINQAIMNNTLEQVFVTACAGIKELVAMPLRILLNYRNNKAKFITLSDYTLVSSDGDKCVITDGTSTITYSLQGQTVLVPANGVDLNVTPIDGGQHVSADGKSLTNIAVYLKAVYDGTITGNIVSFEWHGMTFTWDLSQTVDTGISVLSTDIRTPDKTKVIGKIRPEGQYQLLRQQWNTTVEVENYWWVDSKHVLELNQHAFVLKRNTGELDDWNGERFEKVYEVGRDKILPTNIIRYFTTNGYNTSLPNMFCTFQEQNGMILMTVMNPRRLFEVVKSQLIRIRQRNIGEALNDTTIDGTTALFNTYNPLTAAQLLSKAEWSSTIVDHWLIIGCHIGNNYDQWAFVVDLNNGSLARVVQGYGYVGLHGDLTGGQIPTDFFDQNRGFNDTVQPLATLISENQQPDNLDAAYEVGDINRINNITTRVVGTSEQQWYIKKKLYGIVSHLTFSNGSFVKQVLPITNNFSAIYKSPSFASAVLGDLFVQVTPLASMFSFDGAMGALWQTLCGLLTYPCIYTICPRLGQLVYLQQTFGQYAYVHYNSSKSMPEQDIKNSTTDSGMSDAKKKQTDPVLSSTFTFDKQKFSQNESVYTEYYNQIIMTLIASFAESLQILDKKQSVNEEVNQTAMSDVGKKFLDNAIANTGDMLASAIITQSKNDSGVTSVVTGLKSLDMFYSTCDQQRVYAGPGFVEHQMVADCVAQSVTDTQVEGKVQQLFFCIRALTTMQVTLTIELELAAAKWLAEEAESIGQQMVCGNSLGAVGAGMKVAAMAIEMAVKAQQVALVEIEKILDAICARGITVNVDGAVSRHALSIEGKHKYGEKNELFLWPCFGVQPGQIKYTDEWVECGVRNTPWSLSLASVKYFTNGMMNMCNAIMSWRKTRYSSNNMGTSVEARANVGDLLPWGPAQGQNDFGKPGDTYRAYYMCGRVPFYQASAVGKAEERTLPDDMACIEGVNRFLPNEPFKNENIGMSDPAFAPSLINDFIIDKSWDLAQCATYGLQQWVTVKDTKITNCPPSNMRVDGTFCGVAVPYAAIEVKRGIDKAYMRPWAITPNTLAFNCTGYNSILQDKLYHSFDGISYRIVNLIGSPGMNKNRQSFWYSFQVNDRFKRSNICPANELQGNFESEPVQAVESIDKLWSTITVAAKEKGLEAGTIGEDKDAVRWAVPLFTEPVSTLPACVKTMAAATLAVAEGVTALVTTQVTDTNGAYKAPLSVDFTIGKNVYRATEEYICSVQPAEAGNVITDLIPILGLKFIGSTPTEAFFYSKSTRCYYSFSGSSLTKLDMMERFRDIQKGYWDFVNQEVVMPCLMTFKRLNEEVEDKDTETDNIIIPVLSKSEVSGELPPPITTIFNDRSWYKCVSLPCGFAYQGPNRVIINRAVFCEYMERSIKDNFNKWKKMSRNKYVTHREYPEVYDNIMQDVHGVDGWTYNPFVLVTSALGQSEDADCMFEWTITFCWPVEMDLLYGTDNYATVNIMAETMTPGGKKKSDITHVFLTKELFTRTGSYGYYSIKFQSKNGIGNRERLHIWSDQYIAISSIDCESKVATQRRAEQLTQQIDVQKLKEL